MNPSFRQKLVWLSLVFVFVLPQNSLAKIQQSGPTPTFKLHAWHEEIPDGVIMTKDWSPVPPVNSAVVGQIKNVRKSLPSWSGVHNIIPGMKGQ